MPASRRHHWSLRSVALLALTVTAACGAHFRQVLTNAPPVGFDRIQWYAELAQLAYQPDSAVRAAQPNITAMIDLPEVAGRVLLLTDHESRTHYISSRGTANLTDALLDTEYSKRMDQIARVELHRGFERSAISTYEALRNRLLPGYRVNLTGHSLGGAVAAILMMYYHEEGRTIGEVVTFGQPKVTNGAGAQRYASLPLLRVVDCRDPVPLVPPATLLSSIHGPYHHFGAEIILADGPHYVLLEEHDAERSAVSSFWNALPGVVVGDHHMPSYLARIEAKVTRAEQVQYEDRNRYRCTPVLVP